MSINQNAHELLDRYLLAVKRELTGKDRADITREIESYVIDRLEENHAGEGEITRAEAEAVLTDMGSPRKIAGQYSPNRYLIGPRLFPIYFLVVKILSIVVFGALTLSLIISGLTGEIDSIMGTSLQYVGAVWSGVLTAAGMVTLIFAIIERATEGKTVEELEDFYKLDLSDLPELPKEEKQPNRLGLIIEIIFGAIGITFFSYVQSSGGNIPFFFNPSAGSDILPFFTKNFVRFIPFMIALAGLDIARNFTILIQDYHSALTNWWEIITIGANVILNIFLIQALPLISLQWFINLTGVNAFDRLQELTNTSIAVVIGLIIIGSMIDLIRKVVRELRKPVAA